MVRIPARAGSFFFTTVSRPDLVPIQPLIQWVPGAFSLGIKRPGREADRGQECVELYYHSSNTPFGVVLSYFYLRSLILRRNLPTEFSSVTSVIDNIHVLVPHKSDRFIGECIFRTVMSHQ
jgi:hypothetical protein